MKKTQVGRSSKTPWLCLAVSCAAAVLNGCGGSSPAASTLHLPKITKVVPVSLSSPAIHHARLLARYTCDGANVPPPLSWGKVPSSVEELALFAVRIGARGSKSSIEWAMAGVKPTLHHIAAGEVPKGAFVLTGSNGTKRYSICPDRGQTTHYEFSLYALPPRIRTGPQLKATALLNNLTGARLEGRSPAVGKILASYTRR